MKMIAYSSSINFRIGCQILPHGDVIVTVSLGTACFCLESTQGAARKSETAKTATNIGFIRISRRSLRGFDRLGEAQEYADLLTARSAISQAFVALQGN